MRKITELEPGDFVKFHDSFHEIESIHGVGPNGELEKPSKGGFYVRTTDGLKVGMMQAQSYAKKEDLDSTQSSV